jgi:hypothetical protein
MTDGGTSFIEKNPEEAQFPAFEKLEQLRNFQIFR